MDNRIRQVKVREGSTDIYITGGQGGGSWVTLQPGMEIHQSFNKDNSFYIKELCDYKKFFNITKAGIYGVVIKEEKEKIIKLIEEGKFQCEEDLVSKAVSALLKKY